MANSELVALVERFFREIVNSAEVLTSEEFVTEDFFMVTPASVYYGRKDSVAYIQSLKESLEGFQMLPNTIIETTGGVVAEVDLSGTPVKEFLGMPPSFKRFETPATCTFKFVDNKIKSVTVDYDLTVLLKRD